MDDALDAAELNKLDAEAEQAIAEAGRIAQETRRLAVETAKLEIESAKLAADLRASLAYAATAEMRAEMDRRNHAATLTADRFHHIYYFSEAVTTRSVDECIGQLTVWQRLAADAETKPAIEIVITSPGGSVIAGMVLYDFIQTIRRAGHYVTTSCLGMAASMGGILLQAGDRRVMGKEAYLLIHEVSAGTSGKMGEMEDDVAFLQEDGRAHPPHSGRAVHAVNQADCPAVGAQRLVAGLRRGVVSGLWMRFGNAAPPSLHPPRCFGPRPPMATRRPSER
jgi:ATP-dependent protease ClpP protease subunit